MGSPVSPIVANLCMKEIEELSHNQSTTPPKKWLRFVNDIFTMIKKQALTYFHNLLNSIDPHIKFTFEQEQDNDRTGIFRRLSHTKQRLFNYQCLQKINTHRQIPGL